MSKEKKKLSKKKLAELEARANKGNLKQDVGLTDKKGDNLSREQDQQSQQKGDLGELREIKREGGGPK
jgi:hypothetical protein